MFTARHAAIAVRGRPRDAGTAEFANSRLDWRRLLAEAGGTLLLAIGLAWALRRRPSPAADLAAQGAQQGGSPANSTLPVPAGITGPADSLEVRWIAPGSVTPAMREWFGRFPAGTETRDDVYLLHPRLRGLGVKLRDGSAVDLKALLGTPEPIDLPDGARGALELWRKWSFSGDSYGPWANGGEPGQGWAVVHKNRISTWFPLASGDAVEPGDYQATETGCAVELAEIGIGTARYVSVGFEARGASGLLRASLEHAAGLVFAVPLPPGSEFSFSLENSQSYAEWLARTSGRMTGPVCAVPDRLCPWCPAWPGRAPFRVPGGHPVLVQCPAGDQAGDAEQGRERDDAERRREVRLVRDLRVLQRGIGELAIVRDP